jgi:hypothetical protein
MKTIDGAMRSLFLPIACKFDFYKTKRDFYARKFSATFATKSFIDRMTASPASFRVSLGALVASMIWAAGVLVWGL